MEKVFVRSHGGYVPRKAPSATVDIYVIRFNKAASELMDDLDKVDVFKDGKDFIIKEGTDLTLRRYGGGVRLNSRGLSNAMEKNVYSVHKEEGGVRLCPER